MSNHRGGSPAFHWARMDVRSLGRRFADNMFATFQPLIKWRPGLRDAAELILIVSALPLYYLVRGVAHAHVDDAVARGVAIVNLEKSLGIFWEVQLQSWILPYDWLVKFLNGFYLYGHLPIIGVLAIWRRYR